jgi:hypothetical protein
MAYGKQKQSNDEITYDVEEVLGVYKPAQKENGWEGLVTITSWNKNPAKIDIRSWSADRTRMMKGITLSPQEATNLYNILDEWLRGEEDPSEEQIEEGDPAEEDQCLECDENGDDIPL